MDVVMPQLGETVREGTISVWHKKVGDAVRPDEPLFEVETDKATTDVPAPAAGVLAQIIVPQGERVEVGTRLAVIQTAVRGGARGGGEARLSPVVRKLLAEHHIDDPAVIAGTGAEGRVTRDDVLAYVERHRASEVRETVVPMTRIRKLTAEHMVSSAATSPHVLQAVEVDFHAVERLRAARGEAWREREGFSLTCLSFVARALCMAVSRFPHVNASVRGDALVVHHRVNLGIAVDLDRQGLIVPVVKDAATKSIAELARAIHRLADLARKGALAPDDLTDGTYTISNSGPFGTLITAPIIHQPQVAILSLDGVKKRPVVIQSERGDVIEVRPVGIVAQCFDHRAFDGAYSAAFLGRVREILEQGEFGAELP